LPPPMAEVARRYLSEFLSILPLRNTLKYQVQDAITHQIVVHLQHGYKN
jgi:hypothetical protein